MPADGRSHRHAGRSPRQRADTSVARLADWAILALADRQHGLVEYPDAFERDRDRDRRLQAAGIRTARVTWDAIHTRAGQLERGLAALLPRRTL